MTGSKKRIYIAYHGGTIGMQASSQGYVPAAGYLQSLMAAMPVFQSEAMPEYTIHEYSPLLDSANMHPDDWVKIARDISDHYQDYDGFIILHGTDTMAYTASALPFMLQGLEKPVIITGSQIPLCEIRNDARDNLITSLLLASQYPVPEVCLYFGGKLMRGCRSVKVDATGFQAFASPNYPLLGLVGIDVDIRWGSVQQTQGPFPLKIRPMNKAVVGALRLFPGISAEVLKNMLKPPLQGLVLETFGLGNAPAQDIAFLKVIEQAIQRGVSVVDCTQCIKGRVNLSGYATGKALADIGVISGLDMTVEAALAKLFFLLSAGHNTEEIQTLMGTNLCGELTP